MKYLFYDLHLTGGSLNITLDRVMCVCYHQESEIILVLFVLPFSPSISLVAWAHLSQCD